MYKINKVNSWNGWDPLKQVILGNVFEPEFFEDLPNTKVRDSLQKLLYETHEDLNNIQKTLEDLGVDVVRCHPNSTQYAYLYELGGEGDSTYTPKTIGEYIENNGGKNMKLHGGLPKPCLSPRDFFIVFGNKMLATQNSGSLNKFLSDSNQKMINPDCVDLRLTEEFNNKFYREWNGMEPLTMQELKNTKLTGPFKTRKKYVESKAFDNFDWDWFDEGTNHRYYHYDHFKNAMALTYGFWAPQVTRVGDTLVVDTEEIENLDKVILEMYPEFKMANTAIGGHSDGSFNLPKPGLCICTPWLNKEHFAHTLPGWEILRIDNPKPMSTDYEGYHSWENVKNATHGKYWMPGIEHDDMLRRFIDDWLGKWVGYAEETIFEVNMLSVNENTILSMNYQKEVNDKLKQHGIEPIYCRFRHRNFWDAGLHCLTVDTVRDGGKQNYFD